METDMILNKNCWHRLELASATNWLAPSLSYINPPRILPLGSLRALSSPL